MRPEGEALKCGFDWSYTVYCELDRWPGYASSLVHVMALVEAAIMLQVQ